MKLFLFSALIVVFSQSLFATCHQAETKFTGQVLRVINLPQTQKCLVQMNFSEVTSTSGCPVQKEDMQNQYMQLNGTKCNIKMDQQISGVITTDGKKYILNHKS